MNHSMPPKHEQSNEPIDTGVTVLVLLLRFHGISIDPQQLIHQYGNKIGIVEMLRCAKELKLKARAVESDWARLRNTSLPVIAEYQNGDFAIVGKIADDKVFVHDGVTGRPL